MLPHSPVTNQRTAVVHELPAVVPNPPGPSNPPLLGQVVALRRDPVGFLTRMGNTYGDIAYFKIAGHNAYLVNNPDYIREILVTKQANFIKSRLLQRVKILTGEGLLTSEGELHLRQRRLVQPVFHRDRLASYASMMTERATRLRGRWHSGQTLSVTDEMMMLTLSIVAMALFSADVENDAGEIGQSLTDSLKMFNLLLLPLSKILLKLPIPTVQRFKRALRHLEGVIYGMIRERRQSGEDKGDLLSMLLLAQDDDGSGMADKQVRDEAITLFLAGYETTANVLTWTWFLLSQNPEGEARMHEEVDRVLGGRAAGLDDVPALPYTSMVFAEALRLYPPFWCIGRMALEPFTLGPYQIPARSICIVSPYVTHRDARYYPDPERFDPERWTHDNKEARTKFTFFPFGAGGRVCIGERFAWTEAVLAIATVAQKWKLRLAPGQSTKPSPLVTLRAKDGMRMVVEPR